MVVSSIGLALRSALTTFYLNRSCPAHDEQLIPHLPISGWPRSNVSKHKTPVHTYLNDCPFAGYPGKPRYQARNRSRAVPGEVMMNQASKGLLVEFNQEFRVGISPSDLTTISDRLPGIRRL